MGYSDSLQDVRNKLVKSSPNKKYLKYICCMEKRLYNTITKILIIIASVIVVPQNGFLQDRGAKSVKSGDKGGKGKRVKSTYKKQKRNRKKHWKNQDKATRKRMKRAAKNAKRRQKGKPMKNNRLV